MEEKNWWKIAVFIIAGLFLLGLGFYIGRQREPETIIKTEIKYVELPPVHDTIDKPVPYKVVEPADTADIILACIKSGKFEELFPKQPGDTVYVTQQDSAAVIKDWATERLYSEILFDVDTLGKCVVDASIQFNRMQNMSYTFTPIQKQTETTVKTTRSFLPYLGGGLNTAGTFMAQGGMFFKQDAGFGVQYNYDPKTKTNSVGALFLWMF